MSFASCAEGLQKRQYPRLPSGQNGLDHKQSLYSKSFLKRPLQLWSGPFRTTQRRSPRLPKRSISPVLRPRERQRLSIQGCFHAFSYFHSLRCYFSTPACCDLRFETGSSLACILDTLLVEICCITEVPPGIEPMFVFCDLIAVPAESRARSVRDRDCDIGFVHGVIIA